MSSGREEETGMGEGRREGREGGGEKEEVDDDAVCLYLEPSYELTDLRITLSPTHSMHYER